MKISVAGQKTVPMSEMVCTQVGTCTYNGQQHYVVCAYDNKFVSLSDPHTTWTGKPNIPVTLLPAGTQLLLTVE